MSRGEGDQHTVQKAEHPAPWYGGWKVWAVVTAIAVVGFLAYVVL